MTDNKSIYQRLIAFQAEIKPVGKDKNVDAQKFTYKYATFDSIQEAIQPLLHKHGLGYMFTTVEGGLNCTVFDVDNNTIDFVYPARLVGSPQEIGSAISYAKRYALSAVLGLIIGGEDDDATLAQSNPKSQVKQEFVESVSTEQANQIVTLLQGNEAQKKAGYASYKKIGNNTKIDGGDYDRIKSAIEEAYKK